MSKRGPGANFGGDEERYGGYSNSNSMDSSDKPVKATAAQMARRKIAAAKKPAGAASRSRGASPAFTTPAANAPPQQQAATFSSNFSFQFGGQQDAPAQNGGSSTPFQFGSSTPAPSFAPQQNGTSNTFGQSAAPSFGSNMNSNSTQPPQSGFTFGSSFGSTQQSQQTNTTSSFGGFGQNQQNNTTPATTTSSTFGSFGKPQDQKSTKPLPSESTKPLPSGVTMSKSGKYEFSEAEFGPKMPRLPSSDKYDTPKSGTFRIVEYSKPSTPSGVAQQEKQEPKQNGFTSGSAFGQKPQESNNTQSTPSFGGFGQGPQNNTNQPSTSFGGLSQKAPETTSTTFGGFGQKAPETDKPSTPSNPFLGFGQKPQENGEKPNSMFAGIGQKVQDSSENSSTPFAGFGQTSQQNGGISSTPFAGFGQTSQKNSGMPSTPFAGFGQTPQANGGMPTAPFAGFGQTSQANGDNSSSMFAGIRQNPAEDTQKFNNPFANLGANQEKAPDEQPAKTGMFGPSQNGMMASAPTASTFNIGAPQTTFQPQQQLSQPVTSNIFGANTPSQPEQSNGERKGLFGSNLSSFEPPAGNGSVFDSINTAPSRPTFNFSSDDPSQVYKPGNDHDDDQEDDDNEEETATTGNIFGQSAAPPAEQPKTGRLGGPLFPNSSQAKSGGLGLSDIPPKSLFQTQTPSTSGLPAANVATEASTPAKPRSLLERMEPADQARIMASSKAASPEKSLFDKPPETPAPAKPTSMFAPQTTATTPAAPSMFQPSQSSVESQTPKAPALFQKPTSQPSDESQTPKAPALFQKPTSQPSISTPLTPAPSQPTAPSTAFKAPATAPPARAAAPPAQLAKVAGPMVAAEGLSSEQQQRLKALNQGLLSHLKTQKTEQDWTPMIQYYLVQAAKIRGVEPPTSSTVPASQPVVSAPASGSSGGLFSSVAKPVAPKPADSSANVFSQTTNTPANKVTAQTPKKPDAGSLFKAPATAPAAAKNLKRVFEEDDDDEPAQAPGSEKRSKPNEPPSYPKLPETASSTAKLFESSLDKSKSTSGTQASTGGFNPSTKSMFSTSTSQNTPAAASTPAFKPPSFAAPASGNSFLSAFGKKADAEGEKERKKRKADDYDSDEETPEEWEKRDREEQEAKRLKIMEASKSGNGFKFSDSTSTSKPVTAKEVEKAQGPGDNTWKPETPIKFGASTADASTTPAVQPPKFGLFSSTTTTPATTASSTEPGKLAPPSAGFSFGSKTASLDTSRATTPGVTTDGEASNAADANDDGEPSDEQNDAQIDADDMTALLDVEKEDNEVLLELKNLKSKKFVKTDDKGVWVNKGDGRAYLLKNKSTGKTRILQKVGLNQVALNFEPVKGMKYELHPKKNTMVVAVFFDHIHSQPAKLDRFFITTETADEAKELVRILTEGTPN